MNVHENKIIKIFYVNMNSYFLKYYFYFIYIFVIT